MSLSTRVCPFTSKFKLSFSSSNWNLTSLSLSLSLSLSVCMFWKDGQQPPAIVAAFNTIIFDLLQAPPPPDGSSSHSRSLGFRPPMAWRHHRPHHSLGPTWVPTLVPWDGPFSSISHRSPAPVLLLWLCQSSPRLDSFVSLLPWMEVRWLVQSQA